MPVRAAPRRRTPILTARTARHPMRHDPQFLTRLARNADDLRAAQRLRYAVFVDELGGDGPLVDHAARLERDRFDTHADQLLLLDTTRPGGDQVIGVYRVMDRAAAEACGGFYSAEEFDLSPLLESGRVLLELGRSCLHRDYRAGAALWHLWQGLARLVADRGAEVLFGAASFRGTDLSTLAQPLSVLARDHLAPPEVRVRARVYQPMTLIQDIDRRAAMQAMPALIKAYLRLGGVVGDGAYLDRAFNTTDVCMILDLARMTDRQRALYGGGA